MLVGMVVVDVWDGRGDDGTSTKGVFREDQRG